MNWKSHLSVALMLLTFAMLPVSSAPNDDELWLIEGTEDVLKDIDSPMQVAIYNIPENAQEDGLHKEDIKRDVELKLRNIGIKLEDYGTGIAYHHLPQHLQVEIYLSKRKEQQLYAYSIDVKFIEEVLIQRLKTKTISKNIRVTFVPTWHKSTMGSIGASKLTDIREDIKDLVDQFCNDYLKANPKL